MEGASSQHPDGRRLDLPLDLVKLALRLSLKLCGLWQRGIANGLDICYRTVELSLPRLPREFDGYRILHITDPHFDAAQKLAEAIVRTVTGAEVDLCVLTGDFRAAERGGFTETGILEPLAAILEVCAQRTASWPRSAITTPPKWSRRCGG